MLTEMVEYGHKIEEEVKAMQSERKLYRQPTVKGRKPGLKSTIWNRRKKNFQPQQNEETRIQKSEERFRNLWDNFKHSNIQIIGVPEGQEEEGIENVFENIMKENFPNLSKEIDFQEVLEAQRIIRSWTQGGTHQGTS